MKLSDMNTPSSRSYNRLFESRFGMKIDFNRMTFDKANGLCETIDETLGKIRRSHGIHTAEKNPRYMEMLTVRESLATWMQEKRQWLAEGEVGSAEVLLAAKDMVDTIQDMIEKVSKMQAEQLPQLGDSIRDQLGADQADAYKNAVQGTLTTLMDQLNAARDGVDGGVRILSGEEAPAMGGDMGAGGLDDGMGDGPAPDAMDQMGDFDADEMGGAGSDELGGEENLDPAATAPVAREKR